MITSCTSEYFEHQSFHEEKYGKNTIVLCEVGSFFELYSRPTEDGSPTTAHKVGEILNFICTRKNKKIPASTSNPYMVGMPTPSLTRCLDLLVNTHHKTVVLIEQKEENKHGKGFKREVTEILSPGTYHKGCTQDTSMNTGMILSLHTKSSVCYKTKREIQAGIVGWALIDTTTGTSTVHQINTPTSGTLLDGEEFCLDNIQMLINTYNPKEVIVSSFDTIPTTFREKGTYFQSLEDGDPVLPEDFKNYAYQNEFIRKIMNSTNWASVEQNGLSPIEFFEMEFMSESVIAYIQLMQYIFDHDPSLLHNISPPIVWQEDEHLILENNCIDQLNIFSPHQGGRKNEHLLGIIDFTKSTMGRRLLHNRITNPITNGDILSDRYKITERLLNCDAIQGHAIMEDTEQHLVKICDMERFHRRMAMKKLHPMEFMRLHDAYQSALSLKGYSEKIFDPLVSGEVKLSNDCETELRKYLCEYTKLYNMEELSKHDLSSIDTRIWNAGIHKEIDEIYDGLCDAQSKMKEWCDHFNKILCDAFAKVDQNMIRIEETDRDGHHLSLTKVRYNKLNQKLTVSDPSWGNKLKTTAITTSVKLTFPEFNQASYTVIALREKLKSRSKKIFVDEISQFHTKYVITLQDISTFIANLDVALSYAKCTKKYKYCIPTLFDGDGVISQVTASGMRHAIIERINESEAYVSNDVYFDSTTNGLCIYGCNSVGKSSLIKSIGICVILAQIGMSVPCENFKLRPFKNLFTRIKGSDDLVNGKSSFVVEMIELKTILKRANNHSLVLADEICRGTEHTSGLAIVSTTVNRLSKQGCSFILATHHHQLPKLISEQKVKHMHLEMTMENGKCKYNRKLKEGSGTALYGIEVAKSILNDEPFIAECHLRRRQILDEHTMVVPNHKSRYNTHKYLGMCEKCGVKKAVDTHHVKEQHDADNNGFIGCMHKNHLSNLMGLCKDCHNAEHTTENNT